MKKLFLILLLQCIALKNTNACAWWDPEESYFNLFAQELVLEDEYFPFLFTSDLGFYGEDSWRGKKQPEILDENIESWVTYFNGELTYEETNALVKIIRRDHLLNWKKGKLTHVLSKEKGANFYKKYREGFDYLAYAKYLEPYMIISYVENENSWYRSRREEDLDAGDLAYEKVLNVLTKSYYLTENENIRRRYGYQIVRLHHYTRRYQRAVEAFKEFVEPLQKDTPMYWFALEQYAGALRGLGKEDAANYLFLQVFMHSRNKKKSSYRSIALGDEMTFQKLLTNVQSKEEKNFAYFLLAYDDYSNSIPIMKKMLANDAESSILKVLAVRKLNQLEREYLPVSIFCGEDKCQYNKRLPIARPADFFYEKTSTEYVYAFRDFLEKARQNSQDQFWDLALAHFLFLNKEYQKSTDLLQNVSFQKIYQKQANLMLAINDIISQKIIDAAYEEVLSQRYPNLLSETEDDFFLEDAKYFLKDILANRYFLQKEWAKSFLSNNKLSYLQDYPDIELTQKINQFYTQKNKTKFEQDLMNLSNDIGDTYPFFQVIYGDNAMQNGDFQKAANHYSGAESFRIKRDGYWQDSEDEEYVKHLPGDSYDGFNNISYHILGTERWVSYSSPLQVSMAPPQHSFDFIPTKMNKLHLAKIMMKLTEISKGNSQKSLEAHKLIGNLLYNTSKLGYFRHIFVMDVNNRRSTKFDFDPPFTEYYHYYKGYSAYPYAPNRTFDAALQHYQKAFELSKNREEQAFLLFQMAKAEQGNYYLWKNKQDIKVDWNEPNYFEKVEEKKRYLLSVKNKNYRKAFHLLKDEYSDTQMIQELRNSCSYFNTFMLN